MLQKQNVTHNSYIRSVQVRLHMTSSYQHHHYHIIIIIIIIVVVVVRVSLSYYDT